MGHEQPPDRSPVSDLEAQEALARLSAYVDRLGGARGTELRDLRARHAWTPLPAVAAHREVVELLGPIGLAGFERASGMNPRWGRWPTIEDVERRRAVRVVAPE